MWYYEIIQSQQYNNDMKWHYRSKGVVVGPRSKRWAPSLAKFFWVATIAGIKNVVSTSDLKIDLSPCTYDTWQGLRRSGNSGPASRRLKDQSKYYRSQEWRTRSWLCYPPLPYIYRQWSAAGQMLMSTRIGCCCKLRCPADPLFDQS